MKRFGYPIGDCPIVIAKTLAIREAVRSAMHIGTSKVFVENDSQVAINLFLAKVRLQE